MEVNQLDYDFNKFSIEMKYRATIKDLCFQFS